MEARDLTGGRVINQSLERVKNINQSLKRVKNINQSLERLKIKIRA